LSVRAIREVYVLLFFWPGSKMPGEKRQTLVEWKISFQFNSAKTVSSKELIEKNGNGFFD